MPTAEKQYAIVTHETIDIQITKNIISINAIVQKYVFDCFPANYAVW